MSTETKQRFSDNEIDAIKESVDLAALVGASIALKRNGDEFVGLCPFHSESTPSFHVVPKKRMYFCFGCRATGDAIKWLQETSKISFADAIERLSCGNVPRVTLKQPPLPPAANNDDQIKRIKKARSIWNECVGARGTIVENYLASRGLDGVAIPATIKFHPKLWHAEASKLMPAMVAAVVNSQKNITGIHRTFLKPDGSSKVENFKAKLMLGQCSGGHVWIDMPQSTRLAIAEGIETALSVKKACLGLTVWAALSLGNMGAPIPEHITDLILCADGDNKDPASADNILRAAAKKFMRPGRRVRIARPRDGFDYNDMARGKHD